MSALPVSLSLSRKRRLLGRAVAHSRVRLPRRFKPEEPNPAQQKCVEKVRSYLFVFLKLCGESRESAKRKPVRV